MEIELVEKKLKGKIYLVSNDEEKEIYEMLPDGEPGDLFGKYIEKNRPIWFKKKKINEVRLKYSI